MPDADAPELLHRLRSLISRLDMEIELEADGEAGGGARTTVAEALLTLAALENSVHGRAVPEAVVADDDPRLRDLLVKRLRVTGLRVRAVDDARDLAQPGPGGVLAVVDLGIARELSPELRQLVAALRPIVVTGDSTAAGRAEALRLGACAVLVKPYPWCDLVRAVTRRLMEG